MDKYTMGYKYRIYPNKTQQELINKTLGCCRFVYNHFLAIRRDEWKANNNSITYSQTSKLLTDLKRREETEWLKEVDAVALQQSLRDLDKSYQNFFKKHSGYPKFKSKHNHAQSYRTQTGKNLIRIEGAKIKVPKIGLLKTRLSRLFDGKILNATISHTASDKYYISLCVEQERTIKQNMGNMIGIDVGIKEFYTDSNGNSIDNPRTLQKYSHKLARAQRRLSSKMPRSINHNKQRVRVARIHEHIANIRKDFLHKLSTKLVHENQMIAIEDLKVKNMMQNHKLAKHIGDVSWSEFFRMLEYKAPMHNSKVIHIPTFYPSSQICHDCGYRNKLTKNLAVREWTCPKCNTHHDRDENAAKNILAKALETIT